MQFSKYMADTENTVSNGLKDLTSLPRILVVQTLVGLSGLEPPTSRLSGVRSNRLSYKPG